MVVAFTCGVGIGQVASLHAVRPSARRVLRPVGVRTGAVAEPALRDVDPVPSTVMPLTVAVLKREVARPFRSAPS